jgi:hypothetical protein
VFEKREKKQPPCRAGSMNHPDFTTEAGSMNHPDFSIGARLKKVSTIVKM